MTYIPATTEDQAFISTGIIEGGQITVNGGDNTKFDIAAGKAFLIDSSDAENIVRQTISWDAIVGVQSTLYTTAAGSFIAFDPSLGLPLTSANVIQQVVDFSRQDICGFLRLGRLSHFGGTALTGTFNFPIYPTTNLDWASEHMDIGTTKSDGLEIEASRNSYIVFSEELVVSNVIDGDSGVFSIASVNFTSTHINTMGLIATAIETANANVEEAVVDTDDVSNLTIKITTTEGIAEQGVSNWVVTAGAVQATVTETSALLSIIIKAGSAIRIGAGVDIDDDPTLRCDLNFPQVTEEDQFAFIPAYETIAGGRSNLVLPPVTQIDPTHYDDGSGTLATVGVNRLVNLYINFFPYKTTKTVFQIFGKDTYGSIAAAILGIGSDLEVQPDIQGGVILACISVEEGETSLTAAIIAGNAVITLSNSIGSF